MSSLRIESLRLVWLETFLQVTELETLSAASRVMGIDQSTVSRHIQALEKWAGKPLIELYQGEYDGEEPARLSRMTPAGAELLEIALEVVPKLQAFRTEQARRDELIDSLAAMVVKMLTDLESKQPSQAAEKWRDQVTGFAENLEALRLLPREAAEHFSKFFRVVFMRYEDELKHERRIARRRGAKRPPGRYVGRIPSI